MNYQPLTERLNPDGETMKEDLNRIFPVPPNKPEVNSYPVVDFVFILDLKYDKIQERAASMRQDPTTGHIYDPIVNPVPETDKKLVARLESINSSLNLTDSSLEIGRAHV